MREYIFRGKRVDNGEWVYGCLVNNLWVKSELTDSPGVATVEIIARLNDYECWEDLEDCGNIIEVMPETVGQYTGLKDKNGKMIFEGDIFFEEIEQDHGDERNYFVVTWINEWAMFSLLSISEKDEYIDTGIEHLDRMMPFNIEPDDIEKLHRAGNIHENNELLKH
ncbi:YopX family protein [Niabella aurantiaca]|uniref:YopX family protein n=1 Tax=Niabella aurantiaca TaxID=379900 RepID=UPI000365B996|nr:YopX family protein [Niabella aurantiaca]